MKNFEESVGTKVLKIFSKVSSFPHPTNIDWSTFGVCVTIWVKSGLRKIFFYPEEAVKIGKKFGFYSNIDWSILGGSRYL